MEKLKKYLADKYPLYKPHFVEGFNSGEILTGILVQADDEFLKKALVFYYNTNYSISNVDVAPYPI